MDEATFWQIIEETKAASNGNIDKQYRLLIDRIAQLSVDDIVEFKAIYWDLMNIADTRTIGAAFRLIAIYGSDDSFADFCGWLISRGKAVFYQALENPEILADLPEQELKDPELDLFGAIYHGYKDKTREEEFPPAKRESIKRKEFEGDWESEEAAKVYPRLGLVYKKKIEEED
ncbi:MAG TPA: DUF4240 domain-containing protein [Chloroflexia bacterium]|nr:DUF4240 domain-containing protein [Chloroflexia bacterium]